MTDPDRPDRTPPHRPLPKGGHRDRSPTDRRAEAEAMIRLWERAVFRGHPRAREELAFWRAVLAKLEHNETG